MNKEKLVMNRRCYLCHRSMEYESLPASDGIHCKCEDCGEYEIGELAKIYLDKNDLTNEIGQDIKKEIKITDNKHRIRLAMSLGENKGKYISFSPVPVQRYV